jgi:sulfide dehydrogenase [flavocytochrome c] flavoprotein chain
MISRRAFLAGSGCASTAALLPGGVHAAASGAARVVVAGGGFAGGACALELRRLSPAIAVTLVDPEAQYVTCPFSDAVIADLRSMASITVDRSGFERAGVRVLAGRVVAIDGARRQVRLHDGSRLPYDRLVVAPGIRLLFGLPEGYDERAARRMPHAWQAGAQTALLRAQLQAMPDGGTVAISVPSGLMRCPPGPYERASLIADWLSVHRPRSKVLIFDANNHFSRQDVFTAAWESQHRGRIEWLAPGDGGAVTRVDALSNTLYSQSGAHRVAVANIIPPQAPGDLALEAGLASGRGWCPVHPATFESELAPGVHVIGDACIAGAMPKTASAARSQARRCAAAIAGALTGRAPAEPELNSVCYSLLAPRTAFVISARFEVTADDIRQLPADLAQATELTPSAAHAAEAAAWYAEMRAACFNL